MEGGGVREMAEHDVGDEVAKVMVDERVIGEEGERERSKNRKRKRKESEGEGYVKRKRKGEGVG